MNAAILSPPARREPSHDCPLCPRLHDFIAGWRVREPAWFNGPVPAFVPPEGDAAVQFLIIGLAPGLRGANRTGRPFTGDYAGDLLYRTLGTFGFARGTFQARPDDGLELVGTAITNAVLTTLGMRKASYAFIHGALHVSPTGILIADSYHCSRYNTNTGRLTPAMFEAVFAEVRRRLD